MALNTSQLYELKALIDADPKYIGMSNALVADDFNELRYYGDTDLSDVATILYTGDGLQKMVKADRDIGEFNPGTAWTEAQRTVAAVLMLILTSPDIAIIQTSDDQVRTAWESDINTAQTQGLISNGERNKILNLSLNKQTLAMLNDLPTISENDVRKAREIT